jgi:uncharacterized membrane protein
MSHAYFKNSRMFSLFKKKEFFSAEDKAQIVEAIHMAEKETSGEIRIYVESKNAYVDDSSTGLLTEQQ